MRPLAVIGVRKTIATTRIESVASDGEGGCMEEWGVPRTLPPSLISNHFAPNQTLNQAVFSSRYLSKACNDLSCPLPDCFTPPKGTVMSEPP